MAIYPEIYKSFPNIEKILAESLPPETFAKFQSWHKKYKKAPQYENNEFGFLKSIRRFFMRPFESTKEISSIKEGLTIFEVILRQNTADRSYILIHTAYFYEYLGQSEKADECIKIALALSADTPVILGKIGDFYCHLAEKQFINPVERATSVFQILREMANYKEIIDQQLKNIESNNFYNRLKTLTGNNAEAFSSEILKNPEILANLRDLIDEMKQLVEDKQIKVDANYLDGVIRKSLGDAAKEFREKREDIELSNECGLLRIKCSEIFAISKGEDDSSNFTNFYDMANELNAAKEQNLHLCDNAKRYYENYEAYIEKAIFMGEVAIKNTDTPNKKNQRFYTSLADAYRLRGNLKREKGLSGRGDYQRGIELYKALGDVIYNDKEYFDRNVERLAECYFLLGEYQSAIKEYEILFKESNAKKYQAAMGLGNVYDAMGDFLSAKAWYLECLKISKDDPPAYDDLVHLHRKHCYYDDAIEWQKKMMELEIIKSSKKALDFSYFRLGTLYEEKGDNEKAIETFKYIVTERQPDSLISLDHLITLLISAENYQEAIKWLDKKIDTSKSPWSYCQLGDCHLSLKNDDTAFEYYEKALAIDPIALSSLQRTAKWYETKEQYSEAFDTIKKMIEIAGDERSDGLYKWIGDLHWKLKDESSALDAFSNSLRIKPKQIEIYDRIEKITGKVSNQFLIERVSELERQYNNSPSPELATEIINRCIGIQDKQYANKALYLLDKSVYKHGSYDYYEKSAVIYENLKQYDSAIEARQEIEELESLELYLRLRNLRTIAELISDKKLYRHYSTKLKCIKKIEDIMEKEIPDEDFTEEIDIDEKEKVEEAIYTFQYDIHYLANHYLTNGYYSKAHRHIRKLLKNSKYNLQNDKVYLQTEADIFFAEGNFDNSKKVSHKIIKIEGEDSRALFLLGKIFRHKSEFSNAIEYFEKSYKASDGRIDALDQMGATYREWAKEPTLTESEKTKIKQKAIEYYTTIIDRKRNDNRSRYGLAKSYLLEPLNENDIPNAVEILTAMTIKDTDRKAIIELLSLWRDNHDDTIKKLILGIHELTIGLTDNDRCVLIRKIIDRAKEEGFFEQAVVDIFKDVFKENHDKGIRESICEFLMKYLICKSQQQISLQEIQGLIKEIVGLILGTDPGYLAEFLGSERGAYLEFLTEEIYPEVKSIQDSIWELSEENPNEIPVIAGQLRENINSIKGKLRAFESFSFNRELIDIKETIEAKEEFYRGRAGENIELTINMAGIEDTHIPVSAWKRVDDFIFYSLDSIRDSCISGDYTLMVEQNDQIISFLIAGKFPDSQEGLQDMRPMIKNSFDALHHKDFKTVFSHLSDGFYTWIIFEVKDEDRTRFSTLFTKLLDFLMSTYSLPVSPYYWKKVYSLTSEEVNLNNPNIMEEISNHILLQISRLFSMSKNYLNLFLEAPHDLEKLRSPVYPMLPEERKLRIIKVKNAFRNISFFTKNFLYPDTQSAFDLKDVILTIVNEFSDIPIRQGIQVRIDFKPEIDDVFRFAGSREHIEAVIRNLFHNAYKSMNKKVENSPAGFKPAIQISLCKEDDAYAILFSDNGEGVPEGIKVNDILKKELDPGTEQKAGTGVGLNLILTIVNRYKGKFDVFSGKTGEDSYVTFIIKLPIPEEENSHEKRY